jgi:hypothetical protein
VLAAGGWLLLLGQLRHAAARRMFKLAGIVVLVALGFRGEGAGYMSRFAHPDFPPIDVKSDTLEVAFRLKANTSSKESLFVWGMDPQIYLLAERRMATRFAHTSPQVGLIQYENYLPLEQDRSAFVWPRSVEQMMDDLRADPPAYVVDASRHYIFAAGQYPVDSVPELAEWLQANYVYDYHVAGPDDHFIVIYRQRHRSPTDDSRPVEIPIHGHPGKFATG